MNLIPEELLDRIFTIAEEQGVKSARKLIFITRALISEYRQYGLNAVNEKVIRILMALPTGRYSDKK